MSTEELKEKRKTAYRKWRESHPITDEERAKRRERYRKKKEKEQAEKGREIQISKSTARQRIDAPKRSMKTKKQIEAERQRRIKEDAEAKALGLSYGKYQSLKHAGKLPKQIPIPEKVKPKKLGIYVPPESGLGEFNISRVNSFAVAAARIAEEKRLKRKRAAYCDKASSGYLARMKQQREAVKMATGEGGGGV